MVFATTSITAMSLGGTALPLWLGGTAHWSLERSGNCSPHRLRGLRVSGRRHMLHMLPEAARQAEEAGITSPLLHPFTCFCVGYLLAYVIEQHQHSQLTKEGLLAVAQRARTNVGTASICVVNVFPVATYRIITRPVSSSSPAPAGCPPRAAAAGLPLAATATRTATTRSLPSPPGTATPTRATPTAMVTRMEASALWRRAGRSAQPQPRSASGTRARRRARRTATPTRRLDMGAPGDEHGHVHPGVRHKHLAVGSASATFFLAGAAPPLRVRAGPSAGQSLEISSSLNLTRCWRWSSA